jgi:hypothetical protein
MQLMNLLLINASLATSIPTLALHTTASGTYVVQGRCTVVGVSAGVD